MVPYIDIFWCIFLREIYIYIYKRISTYLFCLNVLDAFFMHIKHFNIYFSNDNCTTTAFLYIIVKINPHIFTCSQTVHV